MVTGNPLGAGMLIVNINLTCDDYKNWDIIYMTFYKYLEEKSICSIIAMLDIRHPDCDECQLKNRTAAEVFKAWSKQFNNEVKLAPLTAIYSVYERAPVEKIARRFREHIS